MQNRILGGGGEKKVPKMCSIQQGAERGNRKMEKWKKRSIEHQTFHCRTVTGVCQQQTTHLVIVKGTRTNR